MKISKNGNNIKKILPMQTLDLAHKFLELKNLR